MAAIPLIPAHGPDARQACANPPHHVMEQAAEWYALLISGDAVAADRQRWLAWLDADASHRQAWTYVEQVSQRILAPLRDTPDPRLTSDNLHAAGQRVLRRRRALVRIASLAGVGVFGWLGWRQTPLERWSRPGAPTTARPPARSAPPCCPMARASGSTRPAPSTGTSSPGCAACTWWPVKS
ncbi:FecR/PupR family sigma factor regulator [Achromobacter insuavis]